MVSYVAPVAIGLIAGIALIVIFAGMSVNVEPNFKRLVQPRPGAIEVIIPKGAAIDTGKPTFIPAHITVVIGVNNTVIWKNYDNENVPIMEDNFSGGEFSYRCDFTNNQTCDENNMIAFPARNQSYTSIYPNSTAEYTFTTPGFFNYYGKPWQHGTIRVLP